MLWRPVNVPPQTRTANIFTVGDVVTVIKVGGQKGQCARITDPDWNGVVKVQMLSGAAKGQTKSYKPSYLLKAADEAKRGDESPVSSQPVHLARPADDIWAFGLLLYKLLAARSLFRSDVYNELSDADGACVAEWRRRGLTAEERASVLHAGTTSLKFVATRPSLSVVARPGGGGVLETHRSRVGRFENGRPCVRWPSARCVSQVLGRPAGGAG